jgi:hypothetical protein
MMRVTSTCGSSTTRTGRATPLTDGTAEEGSPAWSPDGSEVVFGRQEPGQATKDIWVADVDTGDLRQLTDDPAHDGRPRLVEHEPHRVRKPARRRELRDLHIRSSGLERESAALRPTPGATPPRIGRPTASASPIASSAEVRPTSTRSIPRGSSARSRSPTRPRSTTGPPGRRTARSSPSIRRQPTTRPRPRSSPFPVAEVGRSP